MALVTLTLSGQRCDLSTAADARPYFLQQLGEQPGRGLVHLTRAKLAALDLDALHALTWGDPEGRAQTLHNLVVCREPECLSPGVVDDPDALYAVELADSRWLLRNPHYSAPVNAHYNVRQPAGGSGTYYAESLNAGVPWTWAGLAEDLWGLMAAQLGAWPGLPAGVAPTTSPEGFSYVGASAWEALCGVLARVGCAAALDLTAETDQGFIVLVGEAGPAADATLAEAESRWRKLHDGEFLGIVRGKIPYGVRVFFFRRDLAAGAPVWVPNWATYVDVVGPDSDRAEPGVYHPIRADLPALFDATGTLTNAADLTARANEIADDFFRGLRDGGGERLLKTYTGVLAIGPGATVKAVAHRLDAQGGVVTDVVRHPLAALPDPLRPGCDCPAALPYPPAPPSPTWGGAVSFTGPVTFTGSTIDVTNETVNFTGATSTIWNTGTTLKLNTGATFALDGPTVNVTADTTVTVNNGVTLTLAAAGTGAVAANLPVTFPTTGALGTAPAGYVVLPQVTATGTPTMVLPEGTPVWNSADDKLWMSLGAGAFVEVPTGAVLANPMTTVGDIIYGLAAGVPARRAGNPLTDRYFLSSKGDGVTPQPPTWEALTAADLPPIDGVVVGGATPAAGTFTTLQATGDLTVDGNLTVSGTTVTVNTDNITAEDPLIKLATGNVTDAVDVGLYALYRPAATDLYTGLFRDATDGKYRLFSGLQVEPTTTVDTAGAGYAAATLVLGALELSTALSVANGGTGAATLTSNGVLIGNGTGAVSVTAEGATGKVLTGVTGGDPTWQDTVTATAITERVLASNYTTTTTFADTGCGTLALPSAGTYDIEYYVRTVIHTNNTTHAITCKLRNTSDGTDVANSEMVVGAHFTANVRFDENASLKVRVTIAAAKNFQLWAKHDTTATVITFTLVATSITKMIATKIAP